VKLLNSSSYLDGLEPDARSRVMGSLDRTRYGSDKDYVTPLIGRDSLNYDDRRREIRDEILPKVNDTGFNWLNQAEIDQAEKIGSYSIMLPYRERLPQVESYFENRKLSYSDEGLTFARNQLSAMMPRNLKLLSVTNAFENMPKGTNLGAPFFTADRRNLPGVLKYARKTIESGFKVYPEPICLLYWRGQPKGIGQNPKQRTVWGYPHWLTVLELMIQKALLDAVKWHPAFSAWVGVSRVNEVVTDLLDTARYPLLSVDFSGYDASVPAVLIEAAFKVIEDCFEPSARNHIRFVRDQFLHIPLLTPDGILTGRNGSVPSGSGLTNFVDGLVQIMLAHYCAYMTRNTVKGITVQGDDGVWSFTRPWDNGDIIDLCDEFGVKVSDDKGAISQTLVHFLQNLHSTDFRRSGVSVGVRPIMRVLNGMLSYERLNRSWSGYDDTIRWWQQAEAANEHVHFQVLARYLYDNDSYSRNLSASEVVRRGGGLVKILSDLKQSSFPYGKQPLSKLNDFRIVRELEQLKTSPEQAVVAV